MRVDLFDFELPPERIALRPASPRDCARLLRGRRRRDSTIASCAICPALLRARRRAGVQRHAGDPGPARRPARRGADRRDPAQARGAARAGAPSSATPSGCATATGSISAPASPRRRRARTRTAVDPARLRRRRAGRTAARTRRPDAAAALYRRQARRPTRATPTIIRRCSRARRARSPRRPRRCISRPALMAALAAAGIGHETLTLHVGAGTFLPVKADDTADHGMHAEWGRIDAATAERLNAVRAAGGRVDRGRHHQPAPARKRRRRGRHDPRRSKATPRSSSPPAIASAAIDGLITNFHLPRSTLFMLVSALMGLRADAGGLCPCDRDRLPLLFLWRCQPVAARARLNAAHPDRLGGDAENARAAVVIDLLGAHQPDEGRLVALLRTADQRRVQGNRSA